MEYIEVRIEITPFNEENSEIVLAEIDQLGFESYMTESPYLICYIPKDNFSEPNLKTLLSGFLSSDFSIKYVINLIKEQNWNQVWESSFEPVVVDGLCTIKASFHKGLPKTPYTIIIDPKMAFGTGHHETTTLMILGLLEEKSGKSGDNIKNRQLLDMGCGTGILSILAAKMGGAIPIHAIDIDPIAVRSANENSRKNRVDHKIKTLCGDASLIQRGKYEIILANINRNILLEDMSTYATALKNSGLLMISGFYEEDIPLLIAEGAKHHLDYLSQLTKEKWAMVKFVKRL